MARVGWFILLVIILCFSFFAVGLGAESVVCRKRGLALGTILKEVTQVLDKYQVPYFLDFGTALGHFRDHGFIQGDVDVDLGFLDSELITYNTAFQRALQKLSNQFHVFHPQPNLYQLYYKHNVNHNCDFYVYRANADGTMEYSKIRHGLDTVFPTRRVLFGAPSPEGTKQDQPANNPADLIEVSVPNDLHQFLVARYGETYTIPRAWDKGTDGGRPNLVTQMGLRSAVTWRDVLQVRRSLTAHTSQSLALEFNPSNS